MGWILKWSNLILVTVDKNKKGKMELMTRYGNESKKEKRQNGIGK